MEMKGGAPHPIQTCKQPSSHVSCHTAMLIGCRLKVAGCHSGLEVVEGPVETLACDAGREAQGSHRWTAKRRRCCTRTLIFFCWWNCVGHYSVLITGWC
jgi:hypothetical protein